MNTVRCVKESAMQFKIEVEQEKVTFLDKEVSA
jgi:hypothetical protein